MSRPDRYRPDLALVHDLGFGGHADLCAPGILRLLEPVRRREGLVVELGCGSGALTRHLVAAGHRVLATDASPAMVDLARQRVPDAEDIRLLTLPDDGIPAADAVVSVGHVLNYLGDEASVHRVLLDAARALRPGGVVTVDLCDREWGATRREAPPAVRVTDGWAVISETSVPAPDRLVRRITVFVRDGDGSWHRDDERHDNVLVDTGRIPALLAAHGVTVEVARSFGDEELPVGLRALVVRRPPTS